MTAEQEGGAGKRRPAAEDIPDVILRVSEGLSLRKACEELGLHAPSTHTFIDDDPTFREQYARAREIRGEVFGEQVLTVAAAVVAKKIKPDAGRVAIDAYKWAAGRMAPKAWGDKQQHEHTGKGGGPIRHAVDLSTLSDEELEQLELIRGKLALAGGDPGGAGATQDRGEEEGAKG